jgi:hypothetical protein
MGHETMKTSRRNFIKMAAAAMATMFLPKGASANAAESPEAVVDCDLFHPADYADWCVYRTTDGGCEASDVIDLCDCRASGVVESPTLAMVGEPGPETGDFYDYLDSVIDEIEWKASNATFALEGDPAKIEQVQAILDACECGALEWNFNFGKCQDFQSGGEVYVTHDGGDTWSLVGEIA